MLKPHSRKCRCSICRDESPKTTPEKIRNKKRSTLSDDDENDAENEEEEKDDQMDDTEQQDEEENVSFCSQFFQALLFIMMLVNIGFYAHIDAHRGGGRGGVNKYPPQANFKTLVNKNAIKPEIGGQAIFPESLDPPRDFGKKHQVPPPLDFQPVCIYDCITSYLSHLTYSSYLLTYSYASYSSYLSHLFYLTYVLVLLIVHVLFILLNSLMWFNNLLF